MLNTLPTELAFEILEACSAISTETLHTASQVSRKFYNVFSARRNHLLARAAVAEIPTELLGIALLAANFHPPVVAHMAAPSKPVKWRVRVQRGIQHFEDLMKKPRDSKTNRILVEALKTHHAVVHLTDAFMGGYTFRNHCDSSDIRVRVRGFGDSVFDTQRYRKETWFHPIYLFVLDTVYPSIRLNQDSYQSWRHEPEPLQRATELFDDFLHDLIMYYIMDGQDVIEGFLREAWREAVALVRVSRTVIKREKQPFYFFIYEHERFARTTAPNLAWAHQHERHSRLGIFSS